MSARGKGVTVIFILLLTGVSVYMAYVSYKGKTEETTQVIEEVVTEIPILSYSTSTIGQSVQGRDIDAYSFGKGTTRLLFVGGIHGGYEWNSVLLAYKFIDYFSEDSTRVPDGITLTIVPNANPDGLFEVVKKDGRFTQEDVVEGVLGTGRLNANGVDLNRNFGCKWKAGGMWRGTPVSAGSEPFSEPEAQALQRYVSEMKPDAVVFWHSQSNAVYGSECENGILPMTLEIMNAYADAANYAKMPAFDAYPVTGDAEGWLASIGIPAVTVELETHQTIEWERNLRGMLALLNLYAQKSSAKE